MAAKPIMAARPLINSALGVRGPKASGLEFRNAGMRDPVMMRMKSTTTPVGSSATCLRTESPEEDHIWTSQREKSRSSENMQTQVHNRFT
jgi:hypothetical protein